MTDHPAFPISRPNEFRLGVAQMAPLWLAVVPFGMIFGAEAVRKGMSAFEALAMSMTVFAGGSQFLAVGFWDHPLPWAGIAAATFLINLRHTLMAASISAKMGLFTRWQRYLGAYILTDEAWATVERRALTQPLTPSYYLGAALSLYVTWQLATVTGAVLGSLIPNPERFGLDFAFPATFICLVMGFAKNWRAAPVIGVSALTAILVKQMVGGTWFVIAGGLAGIAVAAMLPAAADQESSKPEQLP